MTHHIKLDVEFSIFGVLKFDLKVSDFRVFWILNFWIRDAHPICVYFLPLSFSLSLCVYTHIHTHTHIHEWLSRFLVVYLNRNLIFKYLKNWIYEQVLVLSKNKTPPSYNAEFSQFRRRFSAPSLSLWIFIVFSYKWE
jgi:hypothetical protein